MLYTIPNIDVSSASLYSTELNNEIVFNSSPESIPGFFGKLYTSDSLPLKWDLFARATGSEQDLADYLLKNRIDVSPEIEEAINKYFWDF